MNFKPRVVLFYVEEIHTEIILLHLKCTVMAKKGVTVTVSYFCAMTVHFVKVFFCHNLIKKT